MKWKPYPTYKDSGVEWLGKVPKEWDVVRIKHLGGGDCASIQMGPFGSMLTTLSSEPTGYRLFGQENTISGDFLAGERWVVEEQYRKLEKYALRPGDIVLTRKGSLGNARLVPGDIHRGIADSDTIRIRMGGGRPTRHLMVRLLHEAEYLQVQIEINTRGAILGGLNTATIGNLWIAVPSPGEEARIVQFLESELSRIDTLIAKQERLIELLEEKRQALIGRAVTKGLNHDAAMKPSGVEWLGAVPAHWKEHRLGDLVDMVSGSTPDKAVPEYWNGVIPWVSPKDLKSEYIADSEDHISETAMHEWGMKLIPARSVLVVVRGMILAHTFPVGLTTIPATINQDTKALIPKCSCAPEFLAALLRGTASLMLSYVDDAAHGTKCLRTDRWKGMRVFLPGAAEQRAICDWVAATGSRMDGAVVKARESIALMREHRAAVISAAVTGKIDVREAHQPAYA